MTAPRPRTTWLLLAACIAFIWLAVGIPTWHIRPFKPQTDAGMAWSFALRSRGPLLTGVGLAVAAALAALLWRTTRRRASRVAVVAMVTLAAAPAWFVRQNHFEWMFAPLADVAYAATSEASFLTDDETIMGVQAGDSAVGFPIRQLAYHHIVNTEVADEPVVATY